jgi:hypothetical protein
MSISNQISLISKNQKRKLCLDTHLRYPYRPVSGLGKKCARRHGFLLLSGVCGSTDYSSYELLLNCSSTCLFRSYACSV